MRLPAMCLCGLLPLAASAAVAQSSPRYFPVDHRSPGQAARWNVAIDPSRATVSQPVRIDVPAGASISVYAAEGSPVIPRSAIAQLHPGQTYRLRIEGIEGFPGVELFPTIEMLDVLHAPPGLEQQFPVPIELTADDLEAAIHNQLVTKVIYLEQPDLAWPEAQVAGPRTTNFAPQINLLQVADERGRPMAVVRLGGRQPDRQTPDPGFDGALPDAPLVPATFSSAPAENDDKTLDTAAWSRPASDQPRPFPE